MKRHPSLEPFSRDHNVALVLARRLGHSGDPGAVQELLQFWDDELRDHFAEEEELLLPLIANPELRNRLTDEHRQIAGYVARLAEASACEQEATSAGALLREHVRWEERILFPAIEQSCTEAELEALASRTQVLEGRRAQSKWSPRRGELMKKRQS